MSVIVWEYLAAYLGACCFGGWLVVGALLWLMRRLIGLDTKGSFDPSVLLLGSTERMVALTLVLRAPCRCTSLRRGLLDCCTCPCAPMSNTARSAPNLGRFGNCARARSWRRQSSGPAAAASARMTT